MAKLRHIARVIALQALTAITVSGTADYQRVFSYIQKEFAPELKNADFAYQLFSETIKNRDLLDSELQKIAPKWPIAKLCSVERCILELAAYEIMEMSETPLAVILDEAIELAKLFGDDTAGSFVNGVLSSFAKTVRKH